MPKHRQVWVKVNAPVDSGVADIISLLSEVPQLQTIDSCQGEEDDYAFVHFYLGDWKTTGKFIFDFLEPALRKIDDTEVSLKVFNASDPSGKIRFRAESKEEVHSALKTALTTFRNFRCSHGTECTEPRH
jgi:hypothetical protein